MYPTFNLINANFLYIKKAAIEQSSKVIDSIDKLIELSFENNHDEYLEVFEELFCTSIPVVILIATAIEGYVNAYGKFLLGSNEFKRYDKLSTPDKFGLFYRIRTGNPIDRGLKVIVDLNELFSLRNKIIHEKPQVIKFEKGKISSMDLFSIRGDVISGVGKFIDLFERLSDIVAKIEGEDQCPIINMTFSNPKEYMEKTDYKIGEYYEPIQEKLENLITIISNKIKEYEENIGNDTV